MKRLIITASVILTVLFTAMSVSAQAPVTWKATSKMTSATEGIITITATIAPGWHIYGLTPTQDGPIPTSINFTGTKGLTFKGQLKSTPNPVTKVDDVFGTKVSYWSNKVTFTQRFQVSKVKSATATVKIRYMVCNDQNCRPPSTETITVKIK